MSMRPSHRWFADRGRDRRKGVEVSSSEPFQARGLVLSFQFQARNDDKASALKESSADELRLSHLLDTRSLLRGSPCKECPSDISDPLSYRAFLVTVGDRIT